MSVMWDADIAEMLDKGTAENVVTIPYRRSGRALEVDTYLYVSKESKGYYAMKTVDFDAGIVAFGFSDPKTAVLFKMRFG